MKYKLCRISKRYHSEEIYMFLYGDSVEYHCGYGKTGFRIESNIYSLVSVRYHINAIKNKIKNEEGYKRSWGKDSFKIVPIKI